MGIRKRDREHLDRVASIGCIACLNMGYEGSIAEIHHPRRLGSMGKKASDRAAIPLCFKHHRTGGYGVAIHSGQARWEEIHGTEYALLCQVYELIDEPIPDELVR